ncbi:MAG TPA: CopG family transcriptional regulator [Acidimicrobiia bacterium]
MPDHSLPDSSQQDRRQFNVYLPTDLVKQVKHAVVDSGQSLSEFVEEALRAALARSQEQRR